MSNTTGVAPLSGWDAVYGQYMLYGLRVWSFDFAAFPISVKIVLILIGEHLVIGAKVSSFILYHCTGLIICAIVDRLNLLSRCSGSNYGLCPKIKKIV